MKLLAPNFGDLSVDGLFVKIVWRNGDFGIDVLNCDGSLLVGGVDVVFVFVVEVVAVDFERLNVRGLLNDILMGVEHSLSLLAL